jgi:hypothetical protein
VAYALVRTPKMSVRPRFASGDKTQGHDSPVTDAHLAPPPASSPASSFSFAESFQAMTARHFCGRCRDRCRCALRAYYRSRVVPHVGVRQDGSCVESCQGLGRNNMLRCWMVGWMRRSVFASCSNNPHYVSSFRTGITAHPRIYTKLLCLEIYTRAKCLLSVAEETHGSSPSSISDCDRILVNLQLAFNGVHPEWVRRWQLECTAKIQHHNQHHLTSNVNCGSEL